MRAALIALSLLIMPALGQAHPRHHHYHRAWHSRRVLTMDFGGSNVARARRQGLPWCGAAMADFFGLRGPIGRMLWVARNWARMGVRTIARIGAVVVYRHHVARIVGRDGGRWVMWSGNDGHRYRVRPRSLRGAIAIRWVS